MQSKKRSIVWTISKENLEKIVVESKTFTEILRKLGYDNKGSTYKKLKSRLEQDEIRYDHIKLGYSCGTGGAKSLSKKDFADKYLVCHKSYTSTKSTLRRYIRKYNLLNDKECQICKQINVWNNKSLILQLDHINGNSCDDRLENLRFICPNCHSQTPTFTGKNKKCFLV